MNAWTLLADLVVAFHLAWVLFVIVGQVAIVVGWLLRWAWVRNARFRWLHLGCMAIVFVEAIFGWICPLTTLERWLRDRGGQASDADISFVGRLVRDVLFYDVPQEHLNKLYLAFGALVFLSFWKIPIRRRPAQKS